MEENENQDLESVKQDILTHLNEIQTNRLSIVSQGIRTVIITLVINLLINCLWESLEIKFHGFVTPSKEDSIIGVILYFSIFFNVKYYYKFKYDYITYITANSILIKTLRTILSIVSAKKEEDDRNE